MKKAMAWTFVALTLGMCAAACSDNPKATAECKDQKGSSEECQNCCSKNGAHGYKFVSGSTCGCLN